MAENNNKTIINKDKKSNEFASKNIGYSFCIQDKLTNICFHFKDFQVRTDIIWPVLKKLL